MLDGGPGVALRAEPRLPWLDDAGLACIREGIIVVGQGMRSVARRLPASLRSGPRKSTAAANCGRLITIPHSCLCGHASCDAREKTRR